MKLEVHNIQGSGTGREVELPDAYFGIEPNEHAMYLAVKAYLAAQRQGTHKAKERGEVAGSTKKLHKQKGTGGSRKGDIKNPLFRSGGRVFGPRPRKYDIKLNKKVRQLAKASALSTKAAEGKVMILEDIKMDSAKTKEFVGILKSLQLTGSKALIVTADNDQNIIRSSRNIPKTSVTTVNELNPYQILHAGTVIFSEGAVARLNETFA